MQHLLQSRHVHPLRCIYPSLSIGDELRIAGHLSNLELQILLQAQQGCIFTRSSRNQSFDS